jgi:hypothetical protein
VLASGRERQEVFLSHQVPLLHETVVRKP